MILCIDIGNTKIRCALGTPKDYAQAFLPTQEINEASEFLRFLESNFGQDLWGGLGGAAIASVVPVKNEIITEALRSKGDFQIRHIDKENTSIDFSGYKSGLGEDRAICCVAAAQIYKLPIIVIDFGTATTVNVVGEGSTGNVFLGGAIAAGVQTGLSALVSRTAQLPHVANFTAAKLIGENTIEGLVSGAAIGAACMVDGYISRIKRELGAEAAVIITGGNADKVLPYLETPFVYEPSLLIDGLFLLF